MGHEPLPRLCFVLTPAFHGATLLSLLLNNHSDISALGDTNPSREISQRCSCGQPVFECDFWCALAARTAADRFTELSILLPTLPSSLQRQRAERRVTRLLGSSRVASPASRAIGRAIDEAARGQWAVGRDPGGWIDTWHRFYSTVAELQGTSLIVDGEKSMLKAALIANARQFNSDVSIVHLVRDPRGFVNSWRRHYGLDDVRSLAKFWRKSHQRAERLSALPRYRRVRYEDLAAAPDEEVRLLLSTLGVRHESLVGPPKSPEKHHLIGNIMLTEFQGRIVLDKRWRVDMNPEEQRNVLREAGQLAVNYGYVE